MEQHHNQKFTAVDEDLGLMLCAADQVSHWLHCSDNSQLTVPESVELWLGEPIGKIAENLTNLDDEMNKAVGFIN